MISTDSTGGAWVRRLPKAEFQQYVGRYRSPCGIQRRVGGSPSPRPACGFLAERHATAGSHRAGIRPGDARHRTSFDQPRSGERGAQGGRIDEPAGMLYAVHEGDGDVIGIGGAEAGVTVDIDAAPGYAKVGAHLGDDRGGLDAKVAAVSNQQEHPLVRRHCRWTTGRRGDAGCASSSAACGASSSPSSCGAS